MSKFHLGWFLGPGITVQGWGQPGFSRGYDWAKPDLYQDSVRALERACFDVMILEDTSAEGRSLLNVGRIPDRAAGGYTGRRSV
jgi:hypothetical protein